MIGGGRIKAKNDGRGARTDKLGRVARRQRRRLCHRRHHRRLRGGGRLRLPRRGGGCGCGGCGAPRGRSPRRRGRLHLLRHGDERRQGGRVRRAGGLEGSETKQTKRAKDERRRGVAHALPKKDAAAEATSASTPSTTASLSCMRHCSSSTTAAVSADSCCAHVDARSRFAAARAAALPAQHPPVCSASPWRYA